MRVLTDVTTIHRIGDCLSRKNSADLSKGLSIIDLLHFMELVLFSEGIGIADFSESVVRDKTLGTLAKLESTGVPVELTNVNEDRTDGNILGRVSFQCDQYQEAVIEAAARCWDLLCGYVNRESLAQIGTVVGRGSVPVGAVIPDLNSVISVSTRHPEDLVNWGKKANLAVQNGILLSPLLWEKLTVEYNERPFSEAESRGFFVMFRMELNRQLARNLNLDYAPYHRRVVIDGILDKSFVSYVNRVLQSSFSESTRPFVKHGFLNESMIQERLPLPFLALTLLHKERISGIEDLISKTMQLRSSDLATQVRRTLSSRNEAKQFGELRQLTKMCHSLQSKNEKFHRKTEELGLTSILGLNDQDIADLINRQANKGMVGKARRKLENLLPMIPRRHNRLANLITVAWSDLVSDRHLCKWLSELVIG